MKTDIDWQGGARELARCFPLSRWEPEVVRWMEFWRTPPGIAVGVSGGADSVALLLLIWAHFPDWRDRLLVMSFDHRTRGEVGREDVCWVRELALGLGISFRGGQSPEDGRGKGEAFWREKRMAFFRSGMKEDGRVALFTGHHRGDLLETMLMRLARGSGLKGLSAPRPLRQEGAGYFLKPLLRIDGAEIRKQMEELGLGWREDAGNSSDEHWRNRLRREVIPMLEAVSDRSVFEGSARARFLLQEEDQALESWVEQLKEERSLDEEDVEQNLAALPRAVVRRMLYRWLLRQGGVVEAALMDELVAGVVEGRREVFHLASDIRLHLAEGVVRLERIVERSLPRGEGFLMEGGVLFWPGKEGERTLRMNRIPRPENVSTIVQSDPGQEAWLDAETLGKGAGALVRVRRRCRGDRFRPLGAPGRRKVSDLMIDGKIPSGERDFWPVVVNAEGEILWVPGFPPADWAKVGYESRVLLRLTYTPISARL